VSNRIFLRLAAGVILLAVALNLSGCRQPAEPAPEVKVACQVSPDPPVVGPATVTVTLTGPEGQPVTGAEVALEGNMSHAGMKPVFGTAKEVRPGRYEAPLEFTMGGDWFILVNATFPDGRRLERKVDVRGVRTR
jgi:hypothetical protein